VLGIDHDGVYYLNKKPIRHEDLGPALKQIYDARTEDKILYLKADANLDYSKVIDAIDVASKNGVRVTGMISDQRPGTSSSVAGDNPMEKQPSGGKS
jgi:biopolymer transport protein TolR